MWPKTSFIVREHKQHSGTINPRALIRLLHRGTEKLGGRIDYGREVTSLKRGPSGYELVVTNAATGGTETLMAPRVVSAAGPYTGSLLEHVAPEFERLISPRRVFLAFFEVVPSFWSALSAEEKLRLEHLFPAINSVVPVRTESSFSMIEGRAEQGSPILKIGGHFQRSDIEDLDSVWQKELSEGEIAWARTALERHLSLLGTGLGSEHLRFRSGYSCVYSLTGDEVPYVTPAPGADGSADPSLIVVAGLSGVGAKGSLAYGALAADLVLGRTDSDPAALLARQTLGFEHLRRDLEALSSESSGELR